MEQAVFSDPALPTAQQPAISWFDVGDVPGYRRVSAWADTINDTYYPLDLTSPTGDFRFGRVGIFDVSRIRIAQVESDAMTCIRRRTHTTRSGGDYYFLPIPVETNLTVAQRHNDACDLAPGDFAVISTFQPYAYIQPDPNRLISLRIEGGKLRERIPVIDDLIGRHYRSNRSAVRLFTDMALSFARNGAGLDPAIAERMSDTLTDLLALAMEAPDTAGQSSESSVRAAHRSRIFNAIERRLGDPALAPAMIAEDLGLSLRYVQKLLAEREETLSDMIRDRRVALACRYLADPGRTSQSVAAIGFGVGFADPAYFSRVFRLATGMSPGAWRRENMASVRDGARDANADSVTDNVTADVTGG